MAGKKAKLESLQKNLEWLANFIVLSPFFNNLHNYTNTYNAHKNLSFRS